MRDRRDRDRAPAPPCVGPRAWNCGRGTGPSTDGASGVCTGWSARASAMDGAVGRSERAGEGRPEKGRAARGSGGGCRRDAGAVNNARTGRCASSLSLPFPIVLPGVTPPCPVLRSDLPIPVCPLKPPRPLRFLYLYFLPASPAAPHPASSQWCPSSPPSRAPRPQSSHTAPTRGPFHRSPQIPRRTLST